MANEDAKVYTPVGYLPGINPGGLFVDPNESAAFVVDRGWPAEADALEPDNLPDPLDEDPDTRGGSVCKVDLGKKKMVDEGPWPSLRVYGHAAVLGGSVKPYLGPFRGNFSGGEFTYALANAAREVAPDVRAASDNRGGHIYVLRPDGDGLERQGDPVSTQLFGPAGLALDTTDNFAYVTNARATGGQPKLVRFKVDPPTGALSDATPIAFAGGVVPTSPGAILLRRESNVAVLYVADVADNGATRADAHPLPEERGRILRVKLDSLNPTATVFADGLDRPIGLAEHADSSLPSGFEIFAACAWPRHRSETGYKVPNSSKPPCLPPWYTWRYPFANVRRVEPGSNLADKAPVETFTPALLDPGGIAVVKDNLYVVTVAGAPEAPNDVHPLGPDPCDPTPVPLWPWRPPPSAMIYRVSLV